MAKTAMVRARTTERVKSDAEIILGRLGLTLSDAINIFLTQVKLQGGLPFDVKIPNKKTLETFRKTDEGKELIVCKDADDMFQKLGI